MPITAAIDEEMKDEIVVVQRFDATIPEIKDFIKHSDDEEDVIPKSTKKASVAKASVGKKAPSARKESTPKNVPSTRKSRASVSPAKKTEQTPKKVAEPTPVKKVEPTPKKAVEPTPKKVEEPKEVVSTPKK